MKKTNTALIGIFLMVLMIPAFLASMPRVSLTGLSGWPEAFDEFLTDHLPFKGIVSSAYSEMIWNVLREPTSEHVIAGKDGWMLYRGYPGDDPIEDLMRANPFSAEDQDTILNEITAAQKRYPHAEFLLMVAPNKETTYRELFPDEYMALFAEQTRTQSLDDYLQGKTDAFLYPLEELEAYKDTYQLYYKYDSHWNEIGAYIGLKAACEKLSIELPELDETVIEILDTAPVHDLLQLCKLEFSTPFSDSNYKITVYPGVDVQKTEPQALYGNSSAYIQHLTSNAPNDRTLILCGDSFSEIMRDIAAQIFQNVIFIRRDTAYKADLHAIIDDIIQENSDCIVMMEVVERGAKECLSGNYPR